MRRDDPTPFDSPSDHVRAADDDVAHEFWGATREWSADDVRSSRRRRVERARGPSRQRPARSPLAGSGEVTGAIAAIRDGVAAFRPRRVDLRDQTGQVARVRRHGDTGPTRIDERIDDAPARVDTPRTAGDRTTGAGRESTIGQLGAGASTFDVSADLDPHGVDPSAADRHHADRHHADRHHADRHHADRHDVDRHEARAREAYDGGNTGSYDYGSFDDGGFGGLAGSVNHRRSRPRDHSEPTTIDPFVPEPSVRTTTRAAAGAPTPDDELAARLGLGAVDPLLVRLGALVVATVLLVPLALAMRGDDDGSVRTGTVMTRATTVDPDDAAGAAPPADDEATEPADDSSVASGANGAASTADAVEAAATDVASADDASAPAETLGDAPAAATATTAAANFSAREESVAAHGASTAAGAATADDAAERLMPECPQIYAAAGGDSWYRIADAAGIAPSELLAENRATLDTPIFPGDEICLTAGATVPGPPETTPDPTSGAGPATTAPATTAPAAPATTSTTTTTTVPPTTAPPAPAEVEQIIRDVWPDELEDKALEIAYRESRHVPTAWNGHCCYGLFQLYWTVHRAWLGDYGISTSTDLFDARKNARAAYALYERSGGWGPWGG
jgi:hypothetical protein